MEISLTPHARQDLRDVYFYSLDNFGKAAAQSYIDSFNNAFDLLKTNPKLGKPYILVSKNLRFLTHRFHLIFYRIDKDTIHILRMFHTKRDIRDLFEN